MTLEQKQYRAYAVTLITGIAFGIWTGSFWAGLFMLGPMLLLGGLVVAVQHCVTRAIQGKPIDE